MPSNPVDPSAQFVFRCLRDENDARQFADLNQRVTGEGAICARLIQKRPGVTFEDFFIAEDTATGEVVSTTCLIPWEVNFHGLRLRAAMLEMVVTDPGYRRHGLVRAQIQRFQTLVRERGFDFSIIQGIPFYYRQFGYGYALDHTHAIQLKPSEIPSAAGEGPLRLRPFGQEDIPAAAWLYQESRGGLDLYVERGLADWEYLVFSTGFHWKTVEDAHSGQVLGTLWLHPGEGRTVVRENGLARPELGRQVLALLGREYPGVLEVQGGPGDWLFQAAAGLGGRDDTEEQWLLHIPDLCQFLSRIAALLEERVQAGLPGLTQVLTLNFFRSAISLHFAGGKLENIREAGFVDSSLGSGGGGDLCIPPDAFTRLLFGYRDLDQLKDAWPDLRIRPGSRPLLDILFPRLNSLIQMPY